MKVTPIGKKFGSYKPGDEFILPDKAAAIFIKAGKLKQVGTTDVQPKGLEYQTRMMTAKVAPLGEAAPYGVKADGTPKKRPGRAPAQHQ